MRGMKSSLKYFLLVVIGIAIITPLLFWGGLNIGRLLSEILADESSSKFILLLIVVIAISSAIFIGYMVSQYFKKQEETKVSEEERMLQPFFEASVTDKKNVLASFALLGLLTLIIVALIVNQYVFFVKSAIFWFFVLIYVTLIILYAILLFERTREAYKRNIIKLMPVVIIFGGLTGAFGVLLGNLEFTFSYEGLVLAAVSFGILLVGVRYLLLANRSIFDKKAKAEEELNFASEVQQQFLMDKHIETESVHGFGMSIPAKQVGGDFLCLLESSDNKIVAANGDVSGHSFGAGLIMSMLNTSFEDHIFFGRRISELFSNLNNRLLNQPKRGMFASLGCIITDGKKAELWNAGHMPVFLYKKNKNELTEIHVKAPALGLSKRSVFNPKVFDITKGDLLLIYSDGVIETRDESGNIRDLAFFKALVKNVLANFETPESTTRELMNQVLKMDSCKTPEDDMTLILLNIK